MSTRKPFTVIAAAIFALMALVHIYRIATGFQIIAGTHVLPMAVSYIGVVVTGLLSVMLYAESQR